MRIVIIALFLMCTAMGASAQQSLKFEENTTVHDFGKIKKSAGVVTHTFTYRNVNAEKMAVGLVDVQRQCECITVTYVDEPVKHWAIGKIQVAYNPEKMPAGEFASNIFIITDAFETVNYELKIQGTIIDDVSEAQDELLTVDDLKVTDGILKSHEILMGFDVVFVDSAEEDFRKFVKEVSKLVKAKGKAEVLLEASTSHVESKKYPEKIKLAEERLGEAFRIFIALLRSEGTDDSKISFISSAFIDGPKEGEGEQKSDEKNTYQDYEYVRFKLRNAN